MVYRGMTVLYKIDFQNSIPCFDKFFKLLNFVFLF